MQDIKYLSEKDNTASVSLIGRKNEDDIIPIDLRDHKSLTAISWCINSNSSIAIVDATKSTILQLSGNGSFLFSVMKTSIPLKDVMNFDITSLEHEETFSIFFTLQK